MHTDEEEIRDLVKAWHAASRAGDVDTVLSLMTEDVIFLLPGRSPMRKAEFAEASRPPPGTPPPKIEGTSDIQEIVVAGEWAFMWTKLSVVVTPPNKGQVIKRTGHTLTILRKQNGKWLLARDANLLGQGEVT